MSSPRDLADRFHQRWLAQNPFTASGYGIPGYDDLVPDETEQARASWRAEASQIAGEADVIPLEGLSPADTVTLDCVKEAASQEIDMVDLARVEYTITGMRYGGPPTFLSVAARTVLVDAAAAEAYLIRLRRGGDWIDEICERLRSGARKGRLPVAPLTERAIAWATKVLASPGTSPVLSPPPPAGWDRAEAWESERRAIADEIVHPAIARWLDLVAELLPLARPPERAGLIHLPGGEEDYARAVRIYTTLPLSPEEIHQTGLSQLEALEARAVELGARLGLQDLNAVYAALRESAGKIPPDQAMRVAAAAVKRAEARAGEFFPRPLPPPCEVTAMPEILAMADSAPHYSPPRLDGGRAGTYWFNTMRPTVGTGWDTEAVAFHETVPGHHLQTSRLQMLGDLPALQGQRGIHAFSEGWALYAEQLAEEAGLFADERGLLGSVSGSLARAARLVVDTGIHARGWSHAQALEFLVSHVPVPPEFLAAEVDRYVANPGQALAYMTGKLEILRIRDEARKRLGPEFNLPAFHGAVLDHGDLPLPALARSVTGWLDRICVPGD